MNDKELLQIWNNQNEKLEESLRLNRKIILNLTKSRINKTIGRLRLPKLTALLIGIPYVMFLALIFFITYKAGAPIVSLGFGLIALLMFCLVIGYFYHLYLIAHITATDDIITVQKTLAELKISSFNLTRLAILQLPLWSVCWISIDALQESPFVYGGINLIVFLLLCYITHWLYKRINLNNRESKVYQFFFSGNEWDPITKSQILLEELSEYEN